MVYDETEALNIAKYIEMYTQVQEAASTYQMARQISLSFPAIPERADAYNKVASLAKENLRKSLAMYIIEVPAEIRDKIKFGKPISELEKIVKGTD